MSLETEGDDAGGKTDSLWMPALMLCGVLLTAGRQATPATAESGEDGVARACSDGDTAPGQPRGLVQGGATAGDLRTPTEYVYGHAPGAGSRFTD